jgi:hypothetical protein
MGETISYQKIGAKPGHRMEPKDNELLLRIPLNNLDETFKNFIFPATITFKIRDSLNKKMSVM